MNNVWIVHRIVYFPDECDVGRQEQIRGPFLAFDNPDDAKRFKDQFNQIALDERVGIIPAQAQQPIRREE